MKHSKLVPGEGTTYREMTIEEIEAEAVAHAAEVVAGNPARAEAHPELKLPFGFLNGQWLKFKAAVRPDDVVREFVTSASSWQQLCGRAGYQVVRGGNVVAQIIGVMN